MARKHSSEWFRSAHLTDVKKHLAYSPVYDNHTAKEIMIQSFLNPDPLVFQLCIEHYSDTMCKENLQHNTWSHIAKQASEEHRVLYVSLFQKMCLKNQKDILYSSIEYKDHELSVLFMDLLAEHISPPHLLRHAVVHKNTKIANYLMKKHPTSIVEADTMIMHSSYAKMHPYWHKIYALHQKTVLTAEIKTANKASGTKARKI